MGQKKWSKRGQNLVQTGSNFDTRNGCPEIGVPKYHPKGFRGQNFQVLGVKFLGFAIIYVSIGLSLFISISAWWVCGNLLIDFGERNCSVAKIVGRNPDDSGQ